MSSSDRFRSPLTISLCVGAALLAAGSLKHFKAPAINHAALKATPVMMMTDDATSLNLIGTWIGKDADGVSNSYTFGKDGSLILASSEPSVKSMFPNGMPCTYQLQPAAPNWNLDYQGPAGTGFDVKALITKLSEDQIKIESNLASVGRPATFGTNAVVLSRSSSTPAQTITAGADASNGQATPVRRRYTFSLFREIGGTGVLGVRTDGTLAFQKPSWAVTTTAFLNDVINLSPGTRLAERADGSWLYMGNATQAITFLPQFPIASIAESSGQGLGFLTAQGNLYTIAGAMPVATKPQGLMDNIVSVSAQDSEDRTSHRYVMLRSDGTAWTTLGKENSLGWVTTTGENAAKPIQGLGKLKDISTYSMPNLDTGIAIQEDGKIAVWGDADPKTVRSKPDARGYFSLSTDAPPFDQPRIKFLSDSLHVTKVAAGPEAIGFIDDKGQVWVQGGGPMYKVLAGGACPSGITATPVQVPGIKDAVDLQMSEGWAGALLKDGTVWVWAWDIAPAKVMDKVRLPDVTPPAAKKADPMQNPILGKWEFVGDQKLFPGCDFTETELHNYGGNRTKVVYSQVANTVTVCDPQGNGLYVCVFQNADYAEVNVPGASFAMKRRTDAK